MDREALLRRTLSGVLAGAVAGLVIALLAYGVVKPHPCSETSICELDAAGRCLPHPCDHQSHHVIALLLVVLACAAAAAAWNVFRSRPDDLPQASSQ